MYRTDSTSLMVSRVGQTMALTLLVLLVFGCSSSDGNNTDFALTPQAPSELSGNEQPDFGISSTEKPKWDIGPADCKNRSLGYVTFQNRFNCQSVQVRIDGQLLAQLDPATALCAVLQAGKHSLAFAHYKSGQLIRQTSVQLTPCQELLFATDLDQCAEAIK